MPIILEKDPKFIFQVKDYKLTLDLEKDKNYKNNDNIIEIPKLEKEFQTCEIGMSPDNCIINNKEFKKIYIDINGDRNYWIHYFSIDFFITNKNLISHSGLELIKTVVDRVRSSIVFSTNFNNKLVKIKV